MSKPLKKPKPGTMTHRIVWNEQTQQMDFSIRWSNPESGRNMVRGLCQTLGLPNPFQS